MTGAVGGVAASTTGLSGRRTARERAEGTAGATLARHAGSLLAHGLTRLTVRGLDQLPQVGGVLLAINHTSLVDGPLLYGVVSRPIVFLVKQEAFRGPVGWVMDSLGQIPVRRGVPEREPLNAALATLAAGGIVGVFPEGTRTAGTVQQVQRGVGYLALRARCPVVPVACVGTERVLRRGHRLPRPGQPVTVAFGSPMSVGTPSGGASRSAITDAADRVRDVLGAHVETTRAIHATTTSRSGVRGAANRKEVR
ncbi:MAG: 1-acyl-sn-glycerol-3-phosphate acyltransferase [Actinobacteria bacterium]|nr:1-acyl-sn-glycerol-3-phosphate acyltransferase [Actinomycetota bacterium]